MRARRPVAGNYLGGSDVAMIKDSRNRRESVTSEAELYQQRIQRADVSEEMDLVEKKRRASLGGLRTFSEGTILVRNIIGNVRSF